jgi:hypothetical protein
MLLTRCPGKLDISQHVETVAGTPCDYDGFRSEELEAATRAAQIRAKTPSEVILQFVW